MDKEKVIQGLKHHNNKCFYNGQLCPYANSGEQCSQLLYNDILELIEEQEKIIEQYHKADMFLAIHGWKWE